MWKFRDRWRHPETGEDHCPGGCYRFEQQMDDGNIATVHVPVDMFWGITPWVWIPPAQTR